MSNHFYVEQKRANIIKITPVKYYRKNIEIKIIVKGFH